MPSCDTRGTSTWKEHLTTKRTKKHEGRQGPTEDFPKSRAYLGGDGHRDKNALKNFVFFGPSWFNFWTEDLGY
jgi:hypothetical protein